MKVSFACWTAGWPGKSLAQFLADTSEAIFAASASRSFAGWVYLRFFTGAA
jgi:hypothetical protein